MGRNDRPRTIYPVRSQASSLIRFTPASRPARGQARAPTASGHGVSYLLLGEDDGAVTLRLTVEK